MKISRRQFVVGNVVLALGFGDLYSSLLYDLLKRHEIYDFFDVVDLPPALPTASAATLDFYLSQLDTDFTPVEYKGWVMPAQVFKKIILVEKHIGIQVA